MEVDTVAGAVEMILVWGMRAIYGRRIAGKIDGPIDNRIAEKTGRLIGGKIADRTRVVKSVGSIGLIRWQVNMAGRGEIMPK